MWNRIEKLYVVVALLYLAEAVLPLFRQNADVASAPTSDPVLFLIQSLIYLGMCIFLVPYVKRFLTLGSRLKWIIALLSLAALSTIWSANPALSSRRSIVVAFTGAFGVYLAVRYSLREQLRLLTYALGTAAVLSTIVSIALPKYGVMHGLHEGDWNGVFELKNALGRMMALSCIAFVVSASCERKGRMKWWAGGALSAALIWMSGSKTALIVAGLSCLLLYLFRIARWSMHTLVPVAVVLFAVIAVSYVIVSDNLTAISNVLGRDTTMTGRTVLWAAVAVAIAKRPWLGYGFNAFWSRLQGASADVITSVKWQAPHAHNGILDLWLDLGLVGVVIFLSGFGFAFWRAIRISRRFDDPEVVWPLMFLSFWFMYNLTESAILRPNNIFWALYVAAFANLYKLRKTGTQAQILQEEPVEAGA